MRFENVVFDTNLVSVSVVILSSVLVFLDISAFLIRNVVASTLSNVPLEEKLVSPELCAEPETVEFVELVVNVRVFVPVVNTGADGEVGSGIKNDPINVPELSLINLKLITFAIAPLDCPINFIPTTMHP